MQDIIDQISKAQQLFRERLAVLKKTGGLTRERYIRFLTMQHHLNKGVQKHFYMVAGNSEMAKKPALRSWLIKFAGEEEFHFEIATSDLKSLGAEPLPMPLDTELWWLYFDSVVKQQPFIRLGATCILENVTNGSEELLDELLKEQSYLNPGNLRYLTIHRHGANLDHGNQVLEALSGVRLTDSENADLKRGAEVATIFYLRAAHWVIFGEPVR